MIIIKKGTTVNPPKITIKKGICVDNTVHNVNYEKPFDNMKVAIISQFRDEARYLKEWIEFHLLVGVDKFYLTNHLSQDNYLEILQPYIDSGVVTLVDLLIETNNGENSFGNEEMLVTHGMPIVNNSIKQADVDWVIFLNVDEFLYPTTDSNIKDTLSKYAPNIGQIGVNWIFMGNSNYFLKEGELMTEKLTKCGLKNASGRSDDERCTKSLIRKEAYVHLPSVHWGVIKPGYLHTDTVGNPDNISEEKYCTKIRVLENLMINHYTFRDLSYTQKKIDMYKSWGRVYTDEEHFKNQYNDEDNFDIQRFIPQLKERMGIE
jgi:hypothetical protein